MVSICHVNFKLVLIEVVVVDVHVEKNDENNENFHGKAEKLENRFPILTTNFYDTPIL